VRGDQYFPGRSERVNVSGYASRLRKIAKQNKGLRGVIRDPEDTGMTIREVVGHREAVQKINPHNFDGIISIGKDFQVRIWSHGLDLWGVIDCRHYDQDVLWYFPTKDKKQSELNKIVTMQALAD